MAKKECQDCGKKNGCDCDTEFGKAFDNYVKKYGKIPETITLREMDGKIFAEAD